MKQWLGIVLSFVMWPAALEASAPMPCMPDEKPMTLTRAYEEASAVVVGTVFPDDDPNYLRVYNRKTLKGNPPERFYLHIAPTYLGIYMLSDIKTYLIALREAKDSKALYNIFIMSCPNIPIFFTINKDTDLEKMLQENFYQYYPGP